MRICVVVPSEAYRALAGTRIRYDRLRESLADLGVTLESEVISEYRRNSKLTHDVYLFSKCNDARAVLLASILKQAGKLVGIDLFDDYFSQTGDARFTAHREWMRDISRKMDFVICSTPRMREVAASYMPAIRSHVLNDPFGIFDADAVAHRTEANLQRTLSTRQVQISWFGTGDNPNFPVGLRDLAAFGQTLHGWRTRGYEPHLSILTNLRALNLSGLEMLRRLPLRYQIEEWTEQREQAQIAGSLFCFLPVNMQNFSIAKSLNRAVSALSGGAQVLSAGYPLYAPLEDFIYRDPLTLLRDAEARRLAVRTATVPDLARLLARWADPRSEACALHAFLGECLATSAEPVPDKADSIRLAMLHGRRSPGDCHKFTQRMGQFSVGGVFSPLALNFDMTFFNAAEGKRFDLLLSEVACKHLSSTWATRVERLAEPFGKRDFHIPGILPHDSDVAQACRLAASGHIGAPSTAYPSVMGKLLALLRELFPELEFLRSEMDPAFWVSGAALFQAGAMQDAKDAH